MRVDPSDLAYRRKRTGLYADRGRFAAASVSGIVLLLGLQLLSAPNGRLTRNNLEGSQARHTAPVPSFGSLASQVSELRPVRHSPRSTADAQSGGVADADYRRLIIGRWRRQLLGTRTMTIRADGTATVVIDPNQSWSVLFGDRLRIELDWKIERGRALYHVRTGSPALQFDLAKKWFGERWNETILELNGQRLLLLDQDGVSKSLWQRVADDPS